MLASTGDYLSVEARILGPFCGWGREKITRKASVALCVADGDFGITGCMCMPTTSFPDRPGWAPEFPSEGKSPAVCSSGNSNFSRMPGSLLVVPSSAGAGEGEGR